MIMQLLIHAPISMLFSSFLLVKGPHGGHETISIPVGAIKHTFVIK